MNWTHRRPFRHQFTYGVGPIKAPANHPVTFREHFHVPKDISNLPIDAIRLQLADYQDQIEYDDNPCPVHRRVLHNPHRHNPYITSLSDRRSSAQKSCSSIHSVSTVETDFVHQRVSTIHSYPTSPSIIERQQIIDEVNNEQIAIEQNLVPLQINNNLENQPKNVEVVQEESSSHCRTCVMLIEIVDQQAQQIRQYAEQISEQADLLAKLARRFAGMEEGINDQSLDDTTEQTIHPPITN